jgi:hypothetical protein
VTRARTFRLVVIALGIALAVVLPGAARGGASTSTLNLKNANLASETARAVTDCPQGAPAGSICWTIDDAGLIRGLGAVTETGILVVQSPHTSCEVWQSTRTLAVKDTGTFQLSAQSSGCLDSGGGGLQQATLAFTVTGGTGAYTGASGSGTDLISGVGVGLRGGEVLAGTLTAPDTTFDLTPPVFGGAKAKTVKAPKHAKRVRVKYTVTATDAVSGAVPAACKPHSGSQFKIGRTTVTCTATDAVGNTATAHFPITVKKRR